MRIHELGYADRAPTAAELARMQALVRQAMEEGALGVGSSLIYAPAFYAKTDELIALVQAAAPYGGMYISHMRSEGNRLLEAVDELMTIARAAKAPAEIYHLKAAGKANWPKLTAALAAIEAAALGRPPHHRRHVHLPGRRDRPRRLDAAVGAGGRLQRLGRATEGSGNPPPRRRGDEDADRRVGELLHRGRARSKILLVGFKNDALKPLTGKTLAEVARMRGKSPEETAMDLVIEDGSRVGTVYFLMSEDNVRRQMALPWVSFGSDAEAPAPEGVFLKSNPHPRAYGTFARVLGRYVRDEKVAAARGRDPAPDGASRGEPEARSPRPAQARLLRRRRRLRSGDDQDHATFDKPHQYSTGMMHVFVNGVQVLQGGEHTGAKPGRVVRGPGWRAVR